MLYYSKFDTRLYDTNYTTYYTVTVTVEQMHSELMFASDLNPAKAKPE